MDQTIRHLARVLGASAIECAGHDSRFIVEDGQGGRLQVSIEAAQQRMMAVLKDAGGTTRCTIDVAPVTHATEDKAFPHRVMLHVGQMRVRIESEPTLALELVSADGAA
jgi:hypothetical protein